MLRVHFTAEDLVRVGLVGPSPQLGEAVLSLQVARRSDQRQRFGAWRDGLRPRLPVEVAPLLDLVRARGWIPDFLTPATNAASLSDALDDVRATPRHRLAADLAGLAASGALPDWVRLLGHGDRGAMEAVTRALTVWHEVAIAPRAARIQDALDVELARLTTILQFRGTGALLGSLHPDVRWQQPVLTVPGQAAVEVRLEGRGLTVAPMLFCGPVPRLLDGAVEEPPVLCYQLPFDRLHGPLADASPVRELHRVTALGRLLGATRSAVLRGVAAAPGLSTAELAHRLDISLASASEHATTLRAAGLITTQRDGNRVRHHVTAAGSVLLDAPTAGP
ncbi:helix-turn-helix domain-containing protein [Kitasatospora sp. NPDC089913]|uniref:helix-turn-helix domain-containing protein n=1 Tax=Kitasatospora sp. NPDC089913 TaxID=3364080 RepID=UPI003807FF62